MTAREFYERYNGKAVDIDGAAGVQCVDLFKAFTKDNYGIYNYNCTNGYASGLWIYRKDKPYYHEFVDGNVNSLQNGDWVVWGDCRVAPKSHIAMYYDGKFFGQNQNGVKAATLVSMTTEGVIGVLRPKMYIRADKSIDEIAQEVIRGDWGNGDERRQRLASAGYDYNQIQARVNEILGGTPARKSNEEVAREVIRGDWGNGEERKNRLESAGYNYREIQNLVNKML